MSKNGAMCAMAACIRSDTTIKMLRQKLAVYFLFLRTYYSRSDSISAGSGPSGASRNRPGGGAETVICPDRLALSGIFGAQKAKNRARPERFSKGRWPALHLQTALAVCAEDAPASLSRQTVGAVRHRSGCFLRVCGKKRQRTCGKKMTNSCNGTAFVVFCTYLCARTYGR